MFQILTDGTGFQISRSDGAGHALYAADLTELLRLRQRINEYIDTQEADGVVEREILPPDTQISTKRARELARAMGYEIPSTTLVGACQHGVIRDARKDGGRWTMTYGAFEDWFEKWSRKQD